jgi:hypothetical protein
MRNAFFRCAMIFFFDVLCAVQSLRDAQCIARHAMRDASRIVALRPCDAR